MDKQFLFKTHFSIGKSILTPKDCFDLAEDLPQVVFVEDDFGGFRKIKRISEDTGKKFVYGIRLDCIHNGSLPSKLILFAKTNSGVAELRHIYTAAKANGDVWDMKTVSDNIQIVVPFYDSYIHKSIHQFGIFSLPVENCIHFVEDNRHPFDYQILKNIKKLGVTTEQAQSVYYKSPEYFKAFQGYKSICKRKGGRPVSFGRPELEDFCSDRFYYDKV